MGMGTGKMEEEEAALAAAVADPLEAPGDVEVPLEEPIEQEEAIILDESAANMVPELKAQKAGADWLTEFARDALEKFDDAWESSEDYRERRSANYRIFAGELPPKAWPYENCANVHVPIMLENLSRLTARAYAELFSDRYYIFGVLPTGPDDYDKAQILTIHGNWQIRNEITDFFRQQHRGLLEFYTAGSVFGHSYRDTRRSRNRHDVLSCDEFVIPYVWTTTEADLSDVPFKARILKLYRHEIEEMEGEWDGIQEVLDREPPSYDDEPEAKLRNTIGEVQGIVAPENDKHAPYTIILYHGWAELPGQTRQRPVCAYIDYQTRAVLRLYVNEEPDWKDQLRYDRQAAEKQQWEGAMAQHGQMQAMEEQLRERLAAPDIDPFERQTMEQALVASPQVPPPQAPSWMKVPGEDPQPVKKVPLEMFSHGVCIENPLGALGLSFGQILADFNRGANTSLSQFADQATLANSKSYVVPEGLQLPDNVLDIAPGAVNRVRGVTGTDLKNSIVPLEPGPANPQLVDLAKMMYEYGQSSVSAPNVLSGEPGKSGETFRGIATRVEQATKQLSVSGAKYAEFVTQLFRNNGKLNYLFMDEEEIVNVCDHLLQQPMQIRVSRELYRRDYRVTIASDLRFASQAQRVAEADQLVAMPQAVPPLQQDLAFWHYASTQALKARGKWDAIPYLGPAPPPPITPFGLPPPAPPPPPGAPPAGGPGPSAGAGPGGPQPPSQQPSGPPPGPPRPGVAPGGIPGPRPRPPEE